jgi:hypothetical protein
MRTYLHNCGCLFSRRNRVLRNNASRLKYGGESELKPVAQRTLVIHGASVRGFPQLEPFGQGGEQL